MVHQVQVVEAETTNPNLPLKQTAFFNPDGTPFVFGGASGGLTPQYMYAADLSVVDTTANFADFDLSEPGLDSGEWYDGAENVLVLPSGFYNLSLSSFGQISGGTTDADWAVIVRINGDPMIFPVVWIDGSPRLGGKHFFYLFEESFVTFMFNRTTENPMATITVTVVLQSFAQE